VNLLVRISYSVKTVDLFLVFFVVVFQLTKHRFRILIEILFIKINYFIHYYKLYTIISDDITINFKISFYFLHDFNLRYIYYQITINLLNFQIVQIYFAMQLLLCRWIYVGLCKNERLLYWYLITYYNAPNPNKRNIKPFLLTNIFL